MIELGRGGTEWAGCVLARAAAERGERVFIATFNPYRWLDRNYSHFPGFLFEVVPNGLIPRAIVRGKLVPFNRPRNVPNM